MVSVIHINLLASRSEPGPAHCTSLQLFLTQSSLPIKIRVLSSGGGRREASPPNSPASPPPKIVSDIFLLSQTSHNLQHLSSQSAVRCVSNR